MARRDWKKLTEEWIESDFSTQAEFLRSKGFDDKQINNSKRQRLDWGELKQAKDKKIQRVMADVVSEVKSQKKQEIKTIADKMITTYNNLLAQVGATIEKAAIKEIQIIDGREVRVVTGSRLTVWEQATFVQMLMKIQEFDKQTENKNRDIIINANFDV